MSQIKSRLKAAYENVEFYASSTWVHSSDAYQRANQELFVRECKVRDAIVEESSRPRTVQDSIPQSRLAQYANYEYNESRELCYASNASNISFYYPCVYKRSSIKEPWMIPEIEQLFIWFSYAPDFNILELLRLEELSHLDEQEKLKVGRRPSCCWHDFHEIYPVFYETLERTPGKSRYTSSPPVTQADLSKFIPTQLKIQTFEDMILRMKIRSDKIKYLWCKLSQPLSEAGITDKLNILKSPLGNYFILEKAEDVAKEQEERKLLCKSTWTVDDHHLKRADFGTLQYLANSIRTLETLILNSTSNIIETSSSTEICSYDETPAVLPKAEASPPTRRLYSAVLQGLKTDNSKPSSSTDVTPLSTSPIKEQNEFPASNASTTRTITPSCYAGDNAVPIQKSSFKWDVNHSSTNQDQTKSVCSQTFPQRNEAVKLISASSNTTITTFYSDSCTSNVINATPNISCPSNLSNVSGFSTSSGYLGNTYANNNVCFGNLYNNNGYINNSYFNSQYSSNYQNSAYAGASVSNNLYISGAYQTNQVSSLNSHRNVVPVFNRQPYPSSQVHIPPTHAMFLFQHNRPTSTVYSVASQPYVFFPPTAPPPPPRQNQQRWTPPAHYIRTSSTLQSYQHVPMTPQHPSTSSAPQHWGMQNQNTYGANSNQQITTCSQQFVENSSGLNTRMKMKSKKVSPPHLNFSQYKERSRSPDTLDSTEVSSNLSATYSKTSAGSDIAFSVSIEKPLPVRSAASTSSLRYKNIKPRSEKTKIVKRASAVVFKNEKENASFFSSDSEGSRTLLPISTTLSEDLERQALEQYENSNENFYRELERQAEEQYDEDHSENWICPPNQKIFFGGPTICSFDLILFFVVFT